MAPSRVAGGIGQSSSSSGIFFQGDGQSQGIVSSNLSSSFGNSSHSIPGSGHSSLGFVSGDMNNAIMNSVANSGPSVGASSLVTDANSALSGGPHLQRSASINTDSYMRLPASPLSFSSNNLSVSGSSIVDCTGAVQLGNNPDPSVQSMQPNHHQHQGSSNTGSFQSRSNGHIPVPINGRSSAQFLQDPNIAHLQKKQRLDMKQEDILQQKVLQQLLQRQDPMQFQNRNPQLQTLLQQQRLQQQILQSLPPLQRVQLQQQQQQQMQLKQQAQQQVIQPAAATKRPFDGGVCARRLMQYLYHQRQRPSENSIAYWRKVVAEYFSPRAKKRWCLSLYDNVGQHGLGVFPQASMEVWHCDICGSKFGRGFEATFEVLPRLNEIKFGSGVVDELLFLDLPREYRFSSGIMMVEYAKVVQESVYEHLRVVREGQLRIIFTQDLKILSWEFCARRHEELLPRRVISPQVNQVVQVAHKCQTTVSESGSEGVSPQDLQTNSNMVFSAGRQLVKCLEIPALNELGFSKRYVRCLQISEVVNSMKDLIDFCRDNKVGPIEGLKGYPRNRNGNLQMQDVEQLANAMAQPQSGRGALSGSAQAALALSRQNSMNSNLTSQPSDSPNNFSKGNQATFIQSIPPSNNLLLQNQHRVLSTLAAASPVSLPVLGRSGSFKASSSGESPALAGVISQKVAEFPQSVQFHDDMGHDFLDNSFFGNEVDDSMAYGWKV